MNPLLTPIDKEFKRLNKALTEAESLVESYKLLWRQEQAKNQTSHEAARLQKKIDSAVEILSPSKGKVPYRSYDCLHDFYYAHEKFIRDEYKCLRNMAEVYRRLVANDKSGYLARRGGCQYQSLLMWFNWCSKYNRWKNQ